MIIKNANNKKRTISLLRILIWRYKYISERQFVSLVLSVLVGFLAGLRNKCLLKYLDIIYSISTLEDGFHQEITTTHLYFIFPIVGVLACLLNQKKRFKKRNWSWNFYHACMLFLNEVES